LERVYGIIVNFDLFGTNPDFAFELFGRHEEIEQGYKRLIDGGQEDLLLTSLKAVLRLGEAFPFQPQCRLVLLEVAVYGRGAYLF